MATLIGGAMAVGGGMLMAATGLAAVSWWDRRGAVEAAESEVEAEAEESAAALVADGESEDDDEWPLPDALSSVVRDKLAWVRFEPHHADVLNEAFAHGYDGVEPPDEDGCVDAADLCNAICILNQYPHQRNLSHEEAEFLLLAYLYAIGDSVTDEFVGPGARPTDELCEECGRIDLADIREFLLAHAPGEDDKDGEDESGDEDGEEEDGEEEDRDGEPGGGKAVTLWKCVLEDDEGGKYKICDRASDHKVSGRGQHVQRMTARIGKAEVGGGAALVVSWDGAVGFRLPLRGKCAASDGLTVALNGEVPQIPMAKQDYGSDLYAACRTAVQLTLEPGGHWSREGASAAWSPLFD